MQGIVGSDFLTRPQRACDVGLYSLYFSFKLYIVFWIKDKRLAMKRKREGPGSTRTLNASPKATETHSRPDAIAHGSSSEDEDVVLVALPKTANGTTSPNAPRLPETPQKNVRHALSPSRHADLSARRKSARLLLDRTVNGLASGGEESEDELLANQIFDEDQEEDDQLEETEIGVGPAGGTLEDGLLPETTPSKRKRGRQKGSRKQRTPTPPSDLPPHEHYFFQNRPGGAKASDNRLSSDALITHEEYFTTMSAWKDPHEPEMDFLHALHSRSFDQWLFELQEGFNICLFGWGSKRELLLDFAQHLALAFPEAKTLVLNGYSQSLTLRDMFTTIASVIPALAIPGYRLGSQPPDMLTTILNALSTDPPVHPIMLLINSLDGIALRRSTTQALLARLATSPHIQIVASVDTPNFPLLWDASLRTDFNWLFHDSTTFQPLEVEIAGGGAGGVVDEVNALLGRSGRKMHGREGVMYVLKSLTQSARSLFGLLVAELLSLDDDGGMGDLAADVDENEDDDDDFEAAITPGKSKKARSRADGGLRAAIEWRSLYQKAVSQFIATNEMSFRGLLKEFHDHEMIVSRKDALGTEMLSVPFRREELETLLEELMGGDA